MSSYGDALARQAVFRVPRPHMDLSTTCILAMDYLEGKPILSLADEPAAVRNDAVSHLFDLVLTELFELGYMQTDPNFANYKWIAETKQIALLDFGATRAVSAQTQSAYRGLMVAGLKEDRPGLTTSLVETGFMSALGVRRHPGEVRTMLDAMIDHLSRGGPVDFSDRSFVPIIRSQAQKIMADKASWHLPPADTVFVQRKISGTALLGVKTRAKVFLREMVAAKLSGAGV
jgi:predicted unusual protein kinase regulating ubiquinone biosynthesis (AarF/ABC1/UbiB family)